MIVHNVHLYGKSNYLMDSPQKESKYTPNIHVLQGQSSRSGSIVTRAWLPWLQGSQRRNT